MPSRNIVKIYADNQYYHVYNRGVNKQTVFKNEQDYVYFLSLLKRHLDKVPHQDKYGRDYKHIRDKLGILSYCLMPNHFHLLILNKKTNALEELMRSVSTAYSIYFNRKYDRVGPVFQGNFKASLIDSDAYLQHISRYIHRNPTDYRAYPYSSYRAIADGWKVGWLDTEELSRCFEGSLKEYLEFVDDYEDYKESLDEISLELADKS